MGLLFNCALQTFGGVESALITDAATPLPHKTISVSYKLFLGPSVSVICRRAGVASVWGLVALVAAACLHAHCCCSVQSNCLESQ